MEWVERMNRAIDYIEEHLTEELELGEVARMACCSSYQFQRMFSFITDVTLAKGEDSRVSGYTTVSIPAHTWVIFPSDPHSWDQFGTTIETLYKRFYTEWLPASGYQQADGLELELTGDRDGLNYIELWFAVRKEETRS